MTRSYASSYNVSVPQQLTTPQPVTKALTTANKFIKTHGRQKFLQLIAMFASNESGERIALEFDITRQRVWQLKHRLGEVRMMYVLNPAVEKLVGASLSARKMV